MVQGHSTKFIQRARLVTICLVPPCALAVLGLGASIFWNAHARHNDYFTIVVMAMAVAALTLVSLSPLLWFSVKRSSAATATAWVPGPRFDFFWSSFLWPVWLLLLLCKMIVGQCDMSADKSVCAQVTALGILVILIWQLLMAYNFMLWGVFWRPSSSGF